MANLNYFNIRTSLTNYEIAYKAAALAWAKAGIRKNKDGSEPKKLGQALENCRFEKESYECEYEKKIILPYDSKMQPIWEKIDIYREAKDGETPDFYTSWSTIKARKAKSCQELREEFKKRAEYCQKQAEEYEAELKKLDCVWEYVRDEEKKLIQKLEAKFPSGTPEGSIRERIGLSDYKPAITGTTKREDDKAKQKSANYKKKALAICPKDYKWVIEEAKDKEPNSDGEINYGVWGIGNSKKTFYSVVYNAISNTIKGITKINYNA